MYNRKCDFSPSRAAWHPDFFVMGLCSPFALRCAGQLQAGAQDSRCLLPRAARQSAGAMLAVLRACWPAARSAGVRCVWPQIWCVRAAARVAAQLRPRSATATVRRRIWLVPWAKLPMRTISMDLTRHWRPGMAQRTRRVDSTVAAAPPIAFRTTCVMFVPAPQGSVALRLAAAIVHVAHDGIANP